MIGIENKLARYRSIGNGDKLDRVFSPKTTDLLEQRHLGLMQKLRLATLALTRPISICARFTSTSLAAPKSRRVRADSRS